MASNLFRVRTGSTATVPGRRLLDIIDNLRRTWGEFVRERDAIIQQKDDTTDYTTPANVYGFVNGSDQITESVAEAAFAEMDSCYGAANAAIVQMAARFRQ